MPKQHYDKYVVTEPKFVNELDFHDFSVANGFTFPDEVYLDKEILPEAKQWLDIILNNCNNIT